MYRDHEVRDETQEEYNIYKKTLSERGKKKRGILSSGSRRKDTEDEVIDQEYQLLMEQRKALELELDELKKLKDMTCKTSPLKNKIEAPVLNNQENIFEKELFNGKIDYVKKNKIKNFNGFFL